MSEYLLSVRGISKSFPGIQALKNVDFDLRPGEVHALVGENGAGKSTLIKIISGVLQRDGGELSISDRRIDLRDPHHARSLGVSAIFQELSVIPDLTVAENVFLGSERSVVRRLLDRQRLFTKTREICEKYQLDLNPKAVVRGLSTAKQQLTEIVKAISSQPRIVVMDEPTSALTDEEARILFSIIADLKRQNAGIIYVTHRMNEVFKLADRVAVLRDGAMVADVPAADLTLDILVKHMVGREIELYQKSNRKKEELERLEPFLQVDGLSREGVFSDVGFTVRKGEILGVAGMVGSGRSEVMRALFGIDPLDRGEITIEGKKVSVRSPRDAIALGIGMLPESRKLQGLVLIHTVETNLTIVVLRRFLSWLLVNFRKITDYSLGRISEFDIKPGNPRMTVENLSGGNQQKVCISKWLSTNPRLLIVDEPTLGIDVRTKSDIHHLLRRLADQGAAIVMVSSEMEELLAHSDRIMVMNQGHVLGTFYNNELDQEKIMSLIVKDSMQRRSPAAEKTGAPS
jgi:ABC-type sugar transport system ATPase subunit